jgi:nucleotide-binding universal stress UspA family protein
MLKPTKILVPTDFSEYSDKALKQALDIASEHKAKVYVLHVVNERIHSALSDDYSDISITEKEISKLQKIITDKAKERLFKQVNKFPESKDVQLIQMVINGVPYEEILREQEKLGIDLIVIASLGRTGVARFLIGGVARNVLKGAKCPVLLTK